jgi:spore coat polysaccharide biosynthesis predicted glycosyltransferase SpsG
MVRTARATHLIVDLPDKPVTRDAALALATLLGRSDREFAAICFDGFHLDTLRFDVLIRPYASAPPPPSTPGAAECLLGPDYVIVHDELVAAARSKNADGSRVPTRLLVTQGGSDPCHATPEIVQALADAFPALDIHVVIGPSFAPDDRSRIDALVRAHANILAVYAPEHLADELLQSDIAVTSGGLTKYETALFGVPTVFYSQTDEEASHALAFARLGCAEYAGPASAVDPAALIALIDELVRNQDRRQRMASAGRAAVDGNGARRVVEFIERYRR